jgi:hypothetical protein
VFSCDLIQGQKEVHEIDLAMFFVFIQWHLHLPMRPDFAQAQPDQLAAASPSRVNSPPTISSVPTSHQHLFFSISTSLLLFD